MVTALPGSRKQAILGADTHALDVDSFIFDSAVMQGKNVLELGAGIGLAGMVAALLGARKVALTDGDAKVLDCGSVCCSGSFVQNRFKCDGLQIS